MKGFIKITAKPAEGGSVTRTEVRLPDIGFTDKTCMLNAFLEGLQISPPEAELHLVAIRHGLIRSEEQREENHEGTE